IARTRRALACVTVARGRRWLPARLRGRLGARPDSDFAMLSCCPPALIPLRSLRLTLHLALLAFLCPLVAEEFSSDVTTEVKPWTHLNFANDPDDFQFAIVGDHTGGPRAGVFDDAVQKLNQLMPEFVINVGDCIKGNTENADTNAEEWDHF